MSLRTKGPPRGSGDYLPRRVRRGAADVESDIVPVLDRYARNLIAGTALGTAVDSDGDPVLLQSELLSGHLAAWAGTRPGGKTNPSADLVSFREEAKGRVHRVGLARGRL